MTDADIIQRVRDGDTEAYARLVERYRDAIYALAYSHVQSFEDARDVAQETFVQAYLHLEQLREPSRFGPWLRQVAANECRMWRRQQRQTYSLEDLSASAAYTPPLETRFALQQALSHLSGANRLTLTLFYIKSYSLGEIAEFLEVPVTTVKSRLRNARARLRKEFVEMLEETLEREPLPKDFATQVLQLVEGGTVLSVAFSPDGARAATGSKDKTVKVWDARTGALLRTLEGHSRAVDEVAFSPNGKTIASASRDRTIRLWDAETGTLKRMAAEDGRPYGLAFSSDGTKLANVSAKGHEAGLPARIHSRVLLRDPDTAELLGELDTLLWDASGQTPARGGMFYSVAFSPDGDVVATGSSRTEGERIIGGGVRLWETKTGNRLGSWTVPDFMVKSVAFSPDGRTLAGGCSKMESARRDGESDHRAAASEVRLWDARTGALLRTLAKAEGGVVQRVTFSPDGTIVAVYRHRPDANEAALWNAQTEALLQTFAEDPASQSAIAFSGDGALLASAGTAANAVTLWRISGRL